AQRLEPAGESRQYAAAMREDQVEILKAAEDPRVEHIDHGTCRIEGRFDQRAGLAQACLLVTHRCRMQEDRRAAAIELGPDRLEARIAEIDAAVIALDREAFAIELVDAAAQLREGVLGLGER